MPATGWLRRYRVRALGKIDQARLDGLRAGIEVDGIRYGAIEATLDRPQGSNVWLTFAMREGKNREIRNVLRALGLQVNRLIRVSYGPFQLGELPAGAVSEIKTRALREQIGERIGDEADELAPEDQVDLEVRIDAEVRDAMLGAVQILATLPRTWIREARSVERISAPTGCATSPGNQVAIISSCRWPTRPWRGSMGRRVPSLDRPPGHRDGT